MEIGNSIYKLAYPRRKTHLISNNQVVISVWIIIKKAFNFPGTERSVGYFPIFDFWPLVRRHRTDKEQLTR